VSPGGAGDERVRRMNRQAAFLELGLVAAGSNGRFPSRFQETKAREEGGGCLPLLRADAALDFGDVDAACAERMAIRQEVEQKPGDRIVAAKMGDEHSCVDQVETQAGLSVRRVLRTQLAVERRSLQCP